jgi:hypothetical protein
MMKAGYNPSMPTLSRDCCIRSNGMRSGAFSLSYGKSFVGCLNALGAALCRLSASEPVVSSFNVT